MDSNFESVDSNVFSGDSFKQCCFYGDSKFFSGDRHGDKIFGDKKQENSGTVECPGTVCGDTLLSPGTASGTGFCPRRSGYSSGDRNFVHR